MNMNKTILGNLIHSEEYSRKVIPFLKLEYFDNTVDKTIFKLITDYIQKYNTIPSRETLNVDLISVKGLSESQFKECETVIRDLQGSDTKELQWLLDKTETFCKDQALYIGLLEAVKLADKKDEQKAISIGAIPKILQDALAVCFDTNVGHDFLEDYEKRFDFYHRREQKIPFNIHYLNEITGGGVSKKTLNVCIAGCVHPETTVKIRFKRKTTQWTEKNTEISKIEKLIETHDIEVWSPDGWVSVKDFVNKGMFEEYTLILDNGVSVRCNADHLFETSVGWQPAHLLEQGEGPVYYITTWGMISGCVFKSNNMIPIVDVVIDHPNHRYYTNGVSSHNTNVGKSMFMCHCAASNLSDGFNVLYITLEMSEEKIAERIDANQLDLIIQDVKELPKDVYEKKLKAIKDVCKGKLIIKEYPTATATANNFRYLLNELRLKKNFSPDIVYIDYLNICASSRIKNSGSNSYNYIKAIAEELRGLAVEFNVPIITATQTNRQGFGSSDVDLTDTSESFGLPATADLMFALISTEEMEQQNKLIVKQLKNRYNDVNYYKKFLVGVNRGKMRLYDVEQDSSKKPVMDSGSIADRLSNEFDEFTMPKFFDKEKLKDFN